MEDGQRREWLDVVITYRDARAPDVPILFYRHMIVQI